MILTPNLTPCHETQVRSKKMYKNQWARINYWFKYRLVPVIVISIGSPRKKLRPEEKYETKLIVFMWHCKRQARSLTSVIIFDNFFDDPLLSVFGEINCQVPPGSLKAEFLYFWKRVMVRWISKCVLKCFIIFCMFHRNAVWFFSFMLLIVANIEFVIQKANLDFRAFLGATKHRLISTQSFSCDDEQ